MCRLIAAVPIDGAIERTATYSVMRAAWPAPVTRARGIDGIEGIRRPKVPLGTNPALQMFKEGHQFEDRRVGAAIF